jgi:hypothetical protein
MHKFFANLGGGWIICGKYTIYNTRVTSNFASPLELGLRSSQFSGKTTP